MKERVYEKVYVLDTNIILNDVANLEILSQKSSNLIVLPETVMDEIDLKKSGLEEINFQARSFGRLLEKAEILSVRTSAEGATISRLYIGHEKDLTIDVIAKNSYEVNEKSVDKHILNDRKILEIADYTDKNYTDEVVFISNDVMCRLRAISLGLKTEIYGNKYKETEISLYEEISFESLGLEDFPSSLEIEELPNTVHGICIFSENGNKKYYYKSGILFHQINETELKKQNIKPINIEQKILSSMMCDHYYDLICVNAQAGTGKTLLALSSAMKLIDEKMSPFDKIVYIRKTIISSDTEIGYLPGTLSEKMSGYLSPLFSNLEAIVLAKYGGNKKKFSEEEMQAKIEELISDYRITPMWQGHLRGTTIRNAIVIYDELQNDNLSDLKTAISRMGENCKVFALGSLRQIDNKYVNKYTSALTYLLNTVGTSEEVHVGGMRLTSTVRSKMAEWADNFK